MKKINIKAIAIGSLVDIGGSLVFGMVMGLVIGVIYAVKNGNADGFEEYYYSNSIMLMVFLVIGLLFVSLGGYVAGKTAKQNQILQAMGVGVCSIVFGAFFSADLPLWFNATSYALVLPFAYVGGRFAVANHVASAVDHGQPQGVVEQPQQLPPPLKSGPPPLVKPSPVEPPARKSRVPALMIVAALIFGIPMLAFIAMQVVFALLAVTRSESSSSSYNTPGEAEFRQANKSIITDRFGVHLANNTEGHTLARLYSNRIAFMRMKYFSGSENDGFSLSGGEFITYCHVDSDSCVFLVHVPELRRYTGDAKASLEEFAWLAAWQALSQMNMEARELAVGVKGAALYSTVMVGSFVPDSDSPLDAISVKSEDRLDREILYPFFAPDVPALDVDPSQ